MLVVREVGGVVGEAQLAGRTVERLLVDSAEASKRRLRRTTDAGTDVALDLERGAYLRHGAVLSDDGVRIVIVERKLEEALVIHLAPGLEPRERLRQAVALGQAFGNQHVPVEVEGDEIRVPVTTSRELVLETARALDLRGAALSFELVRLGSERPLAASPHAHG